MVRLIVALLNGRVSKLPSSGIAAKDESVYQSINSPEVAAPAPARSHGFGGLALAIASVLFIAAAYALIVRIAALRVRPIDLRLALLSSALWDILRCRGVASDESNISN